MVIYLEVLISVCTSYFQLCVAVIIDHGEDIPLECVSSRQGSLEGDVLTIGQSSGSYKQSVSNLSLVSGVYAVTLTIVYRCIRL